MAAGAKTKGAVENGKAGAPVAKVPPDGGWGWFVVAAFAISFAAVIPIMQNFGIIFADEFRNLGFKDSSVSVLINVNYSVGVCLGLFNGPILRTFSFRSVGALGALLVFVGMALTSIAVTFWQFLLYYGVLMAAGSGLTMSAFSFAINSYFTKRRGVAMGAAMTACGLSPVVMPHMMSYAVSEFGSSGTALLLSGFSLHSFVGVCLLQPVEWHMKPAPVPIKEEEGEEEEDEEKPQKEEALMQPNTINGTINGDRRESLISVRSAAGPCRGEGESGRLTAYPWWNSGTSLDTVDLGNSLRAAYEPKGQAVMEADDEVQSPEAKPERGTLMKPDPSPTEVPEPEPEPEAKRSCWLRCFRAVVRFFDLDLLRDPIYVNLMLGMSIAVFAEINFSLLMPFILKDRGLTTQQTATMMSLIATADIIFRFLAPFIGKAMKLPSRIMYAISLCTLVASRTTFVFAEEYTSVLASMLFLGMAKGIRTVFWVLVIPDYVPLEKLPGASGIQSVTNGLISIACGPLLGILRDNMGSYNPIILVLNGITLLTVLMWSLEMLVVRLRRKKSPAKKGKPNSQIVDLTI